MNFHILLFVLPTFVCCLSLVVTNSSNELSLLQHLKREVEELAEGDNEDYEDPDDSETPSLDDEEIQEIGEIDKLEIIMGAVIAKISEMDSELKGLKKKVKYLKCNPVPIGFIYNEYGNQPHPSILWPDVEWSDVTSEYAGLFFRAEGGNSANFGEIQEQDVPRIYHARSVPMTRGQRMLDVVVPLSSSRSSDPSLFTGENTGSRSWWALQLLTTGEEVRPINQAIRIWKRIA